MKTGDFGQTDVGRVQSAYQNDLARYHIDNRLSDGKPYCVVLRKYSQAFMKQLTPQSLSRIAVF